ncbi:MAG: hypothetical protein R6W90_00370 [Ignavibacteriaceae bacterium]
MKIFSLILFVYLIIFNSAGYSWGDKGHSLINGKAIAFLPAEMDQFKKWGDYIAEHAPDPDYRKEYDSTEFPKHFIDIDYYREFQTGNMIFGMNQLKSIYSDSIVNDLGILPWATIETLNKLTDAFRELDRDRVLIYASDLGHYVGDGHQPMHTILNYDGQLSTQEGVHGRYEWQMLDRYINEVDSSIIRSEAEYVNNPLEYVFGYITNSNTVASVLLDADLQAFKTAGNREDDNYFNLLWFRTKYITTIQFNKAVQSFSSLIYTAWIDAGKPPLNKLN